MKDLESDAFFQMLDAVGRGEPAITPHVAAKLMEEVARPVEPKRTGRLDRSALTAREVDVLRCMVRGTVSNREPEECLGVTENTVKYHVQNILDKLDLHSRAELVAYAAREHLVDPEKEWRKSRG